MPSNLTPLVEIQKQLIFSPIKTYREFRKLQQSGDMKELDDWIMRDGKLYLNLDKDIQKTWNKDISGYIAKAETNWADIEHKNPAEL